jgi:hypothetical protein
MKLGSGTGGHTVILVGPNELPFVQRAGLLDRLSVHLRARALDRALAAGEPAETRPAVALRARRLTMLSTRRKLARTLREAILHARKSPPRAQVPVARWSVVSATPELSRLADELIVPGPVDARGVAQVQVLITDGMGPLYNPSSHDDLALAAERAIEALRL